MFCMNLSATFILHPSLPFSVTQWDELYRLYHVSSFTPWFLDGFRQWEVWPGKQRLEKGHFFPSPSLLQYWSFKAGPSTCDLSFRWSPSFMDLILTKFQWCFLPLQAYCGKSFSQYSSPGYINICIDSLNSDPISINNPPDCDFCF